MYGKRGAGFRHPGQALYFRNPDTGASPSRARIGRSLPEGLRPMFGEFPTPSRRAFTHPFAQRESMMGDRANHAAYFPAIEFSTSQDSQEDSSDYDMGASEVNDEQPVELLKLLRKAVGPRNTLGQHYRKMTFGEY